MQLFIRFDGSQTVSVDIDPSARCDTLSDLVTAALGVADLSLSIGGRPLPCSGVVGDIDALRSGATIDASARLVGGKVHGSLARAGKVKAQTPKVAKAEKRKKKTGRAKRRQQYNRRFVNVVVGVGRRRGPNANVQA